ncbi:hypothetical protein [Desulfurobacterium atlanticum]|uniref:Nucleotidyltransferase substrate binding protein, HI0074 family n=1 Tax=Desulfurobacterium atlanticum TaxID=240169 RepID=A0A238XPE6_9BACT|nr:hypothetical protein [Desulfurobacterium atlanticum]SNR60552.1 hypothetical protein SAMN06265340_101137 [Desulfurobacterium atlanticum]
MAIDRLQFYLKEAQNHVERLNDVLERLKPLYPLNTNKFNVLTSSQKDMLDTLAFRFSKLQDLLGSRIFREFLNHTGYITEGKTFLELLREIEKEGIIDIDTWSQFRKIRNLIAHDYPDELSEKIEAINFLIENAPVLIKVVEKIEDKAYR